MAKSKKEKKHGSNGFTATAAALSIGESSKSSTNGTVSHGKTEKKAGKTKGGDSKKHSGGLTSFLSTLPLESAQALERALSEIERLQSQVARLEKELETKDVIIAELQANSQSVTGPVKSSPSKKSNGDHAYTLSPPEVIASAAPAPVDTVVHTPDVALQCSVCVDYFSSPIREQVMASISRLPEAERKEAMAKLKEGEEHWKAKQRHGDPWRDTFMLHVIGKTGSVIMDREDGVRRCATCGWEVRGGSCDHCGEGFGSEITDSDASQEHTDAESGEEDAYDSHDSFIDDDEGGLEGRMNDVDGDDLYLSDAPFSGIFTSESDSDEGVIRPRCTRSTNRNRVRAVGRARARRASIVSISDDSDGDVGPRRPRAGSNVGPRRRELVQISDDEEAPESLVRPGASSGRRSRTLLTLDDDDEEENEKKDKEEEEEKETSGRRRRLKRSLADRSSSETEESSSELEEGLGGDESDSTVESDMSEASFVLEGEEGSSSVRRRKVARLEDLFM
ncbi:hypothetical protein BGX34_010238 [Mortierella sp. NVP85]|nr:hypothetical protein BGX34_010238 [Mortierella sp. NVP85]